MGKRLKSDANLHSQSQSCFHRIELFQNGYNETSSVYERRKKTKKGKRNKENRKKYQIKIATVLTEKKNT